MTGVAIIGAGPVGLVAAAYLVQAGIAVTVLEAGTALSKESRASTFHPPTLDMLDAIGAAAPLIAQGLLGPTLQYRSRQGPIASFDFGIIADATGHPYRLQAEQSKLTRIIADMLGDNALFRLHYDRRLESLAQDDDGATIIARDSAGAQHEIRADWVIGADGASSATRKALGVEFAGFTWPERFLVVSTPFDFRAVLPDLASVSYVADPEQWHFFLQIPGLWRIMFPVAAAVPDAQALGADYAQAQMARLVAGISHYAVAHTTLYKVHQRVAAQFQIGRVFLAGDAAHVNNPLGGMGMNGGIHDAVNLAQRLAAVLHGAQDATHLHGYDRQRRSITVEHVQKQTIANKQNLEARDPGAHQAFQARIADIAADPARAHDYLLGVAMISSLRRAAEF